MEDLRHTTVGREVARPSCRADLVIWCRNVTLIFEVKIDAYERENQCADIYTDFRNEKRARFIFLTPTGYHPSSVSAESKEAFVCMSFKQVLTDLQSAIAYRCNEFNDSEGYHTVRTYIQTLQREFS